MINRDYRRIVEDIQTALCSQSSVPIEAVQAMSLDYVAACDEVNQRLRECHDLLRRSLRSEALQRSEIEPKLLDVVAVLDFPELQQWLAVHEQLRLVAPPPLLYEAAAEINEAYAKERPLADLLRTHRILALGRAPLRDRLVVLRKIARTDPDTLLWQEDARTWEKARQGQIVTAGETALKRGDAETLTELEQELSSPEWFLPPAATLTQQIHNYATRVRTHRAREELKKLEPELTAAHQEFDVERGRRVRARWDACAAMAGLAAHDALAQAAEPALYWLHQEDSKEQHRGEYDEAQSLLLQALDENMPAPLLERRFNALFQLGDGVDPVIEQRYLVRMEEYRLKETRKHRLVLAGMVSGFLILATLTGYVVYRHGQANALAATVATGKQLFDDGKHAELRDWLNQLAAADADMHGTVEIQELIARLDGEQRREEDRRLRFMEALAAARDGLDRDIKNQVESPSRKAIQDAAAKAGNESEQADVANIERDYERYVSETIRKKVEGFLARTGKLSEAIDQVTKGDLHGLATVLQAVQALRPDADRLVNEAKAMPADRQAQLVAQATALQDRLRVLEQTEQDEIQRTNRLQQITEGIGNPVRYREALTNYQRLFSDSRRGDDFRRVQEQEPICWDRVTSWNAFVEQHGKVNVTTLAPAQAADLADVITKLVADHAGFKGLEEWERRLPYLQSVAARQTDAGKLTDQLKPAYEHYTVANLYFVRLLDPKGELNFYASEPPIPPVGDNLTSIKYLAGTDISAGVKPKSFKLSQLVSGAIGDAPQSAFARKLITDVRFIKPGDWERIFAELIPLLYNDKWMDPIVKIQLLPSLLQIAATGSSCLKTSLTPHMEALENELDVDVNWIDPLDVKAIATRRSAADLLRAMPPLGPALEAAAEEYRQLTIEPVYNRYEWIGWLCREKDDRWNCRMKLQRKEFSAELCLAIPGESDGKTLFVTIGKINRGIVELLPTAEPRFLEGRPIYAVTAAAPATP